MTTDRKGEPLIQVQHLGKSFGDFQVLKNILPDVGSSRRFRHRRNVLFPDPERVHFCGV